MRFAKEITSLNCARVSLMDYIYLEQERRQPLFEFSYTKYIASHYSIAREPTHRKLLEKKTHAEHRTSPFMIMGQQRITFVKHWWFAMHANPLIPRRWGGSWVVMLCFSFYIWELSRATSGCDCHKRYASKQKQIPNESEQWYDFPVHERNAAHAHTSQSLAGRCCSAPTFIIAPAQKFIIISFSAALRIECIFRFFFFCSLTCLTLNTWSHRTEELSIGNI